ncbi:MAG: leucine-rich repeat protein [Clostridiales bacterium]|nr:leucine-rich repeat protein [Clostridiales bacterium]
MLSAGAWDGQIGEVMYETPIVIFVASKNSLSSKEVMKEVLYFLNKPDKLVVPFVIDTQYYLNPDLKAKQAIYNFGANSLQAVFADKYPDLETAFDRLIGILPHDIIRLENNPADFVYGESDKVLVEYKGHDNCVTVPPYVTEIGRSAFQNNDTLNKVIIPPTVEKIGIRAFFGCTNLVLAEGMQGLKEAEASAFDCSGIAPSADNGYTYGGIVFGCDDGAEAIAVADGVKIIANEAFRYSSAKSVALPQGLQTIGELAFADSIFIESITIPASVERIGKNAFRGCSGLRKVVFEGDIPDGAEAAFERFSDLINK